MVVLLMYVGLLFTCAAELFSDVEPYVQSTLDGHNVSILAYGQTFSGKTHTMVGLLFPFIWLIFLLPFSLSPIDIET